jgi:eukaryotic-like serine/threonine-protein kinase
MSLCINPTCPQPDNPTNLNSRFCQSCGSPLDLEGRYRVVRLLSDKTGFGKIYEAHEGNKPKILKVLKADLNNNAKAVELFQQEANVLGQLNHPGIPKVDNYFQQQTRNNLGLHCIIMEKIEGVNLEEWLEQRQNQPINQNQALDWLQQITEILQLVHNRQYLHRDIKPSNIMLRSRLTPLNQGGTIPVAPINQAGLGDQLVLIDFGTARQMTYTYLAKISSGQRITAIESSGYTAPEQAYGQAVPQSDFFSLGRTFVFLLTGRHPLDMYDGHNNILNWRGYATQATPLLLDLIDELMAQDPAQRPANTEEIFRRIAEIRNELTKTVNVVGWLKRTTATLFGATTTVAQPRRQSQRQPRSQPDHYPLLFLLGILMIALGCLTLTALALSNIEVIPTVTQRPQRKGKVDYFPYVEGADSQGRTAEFSIAVLSVEYKWQLGSTSQIRYGDQSITLDTLKTNLEQEGIRRIMDNPNEIISVGTASCEGDAATEEIRASQRAQQIQLVVKKLFGRTSSVQGYRLLNLGQFRRSGCSANQDLTSYQRSVIIIGVKKQTPGVILDEALRDRLEKKPFADFKLEDYSLGSPDKFRTVPSSL